MTAMGVACGGNHPTAPSVPLQPKYAGYPGFDIAVYPGDALLSAWRFPTSPYHWVGYYLAAPCHRDASWMGQYGKVTSLGWGTAVVYVGQQDWAAIPDVMHQVKVARSTACDYLAAFIEAHRPADVSPWIGADVFARIEAAVAQVGDERLKPIFELLNQEVSYDDIRVVFAFLDSRR